MHCLFNPCFLFYTIERNNSSLNNLEIVNSEPVLPYQTNSFVGTEEYIAPEVVNGVGQSSAVDWWTLGILIYEMLTGTTPFKGNYTDETFSNIVNEQLKWPEDITATAECKNLVKKLLRREAEKRLGAENGASDIKRSKWFKDFNFALIRVSLAFCIFFPLVVVVAVVATKRLIFVSFFSFLPFIFTRG